MFQFQPRTLGIELQASCVRVAALLEKRSGWSVTLKELSREESRAYLSRYNDAILVSALSTREMLMRPCEIALLKPKDIFAALNFHAEPLLPYPIENAVVQAQIVAKQESSSLLNLFSVRKDHLTGHLESLKAIGLEPEVVSTRPHALAALSALFNKAEPLILVHEGEDEVSMVLAQRGQVLAARSIDPKAVTAAEIQKTTLYFTAAHKQKPEGLYFFGKDRELQALLAHQCGLPLLTPSAAGFSLSAEEWSLFALSIGSALASKGVNFRQNEFAARAAFKRLKKPLALCGCLSILLALSLFAWEYKTLGCRKEAIESAYCSLLQAEQGVHELCQTPEDYLTSLNKLEKKIKAQPKTFPLLPQLPKTKEVIGWLTSINQELNSALVLDSFHYQMVKRPSAAQGKEHYKTKVELEFTAKDPASARLFQEALKGPNSIADPKEELQWSSSKGKYRAVFYLKDKTRYFIT